MTRTKKTKTKKSKKESDSEDENTDTQLGSTFENIRNKTYFTGSKEPISITLPLLDQESKEKRFKWQKVEIAPASIAALDEGVVNIGDHYSRNIATVTDASIDFEDKTGVVTMYNNGPGIPVYELWIKRDEVKNKEIPVNLNEHPLTPEQRKEFEKQIFWNPEVITTRVQAGTNIRKKKKHFVGGTNGIGIKALVYQCEWFELTTVDAVHKVKYHQRYECKSDYLEIQPPTLKWYDDWDPSKHKPFTRMRFKLDYRLYGSGEYDFIDQGVVIKEYLRMRAYQLKVYHLGLRIHFNKEEIDIDSLEKYALMLAPVPRNDYERELPRVYSCTMEYSGKASEAKLSRWQVSVIASLDNNAKHIGLVNSVYPYKGGTHINYLVEEITKSLIKIIQKESGLSADELKEQNAGGALTRAIKDQITVIAICPINGPEFGGQTKTEIETSKDKYSIHSFPKGALGKIWKVVETYIQFKRYGDQKRITNVSHKKLDIDGYIPAVFAGTKAKSQDCSLFLPEGNSAAQLIERGLASQEVKNINYDYYGYYNLRGVPMNARRSFQTIIDPKTGDKVKVCTRRLAENERFRSLVAILNLNFDLKYDNEQDIATLSYGSVILAVDQDEDGKGNIAPLILNIFSIFWPELIKAGFITIMKTPIVTLRMIKGKKAKVKEFYTMPDYEEWRETNYPNGLPSNIEPKYSKGLAANSGPEAIRIFKMFKRNKITFLYDDKAESTFEIYFGSDSSKRKEALVKTVDWSMAPTGNEITCSAMLDMDTLSYQQANLKRKIPGEDGFLYGRRMIFAGARLYFNSRRKKANVNAFGGFVKEKFNYQHGETSLNNSIIGMGRNYVGSNNIPPLKGAILSAGSGSRKHGGKDAGAARYLYTGYNEEVMDAIFPPEDDFLLKLTHDGEPEVYCPIIPYSIVMGDTHIPAHGWKVKTYAVDPFSTIDAARGAIKGEYDVTDHEEVPVLPTCTLRWKGRIVYFRGKLYSVGSYEWNPRTNEITITELPHGVFGQSFVHGDRKKEKRKKDRWSKKQNESRKDKIKEMRKNLKSHKHGEEYDSDSGSDSDKEKIEKEEYRSRTICDKQYVEKVHDLSEDNRIQIVIKLTEGGYKKIQEEYDKAQEDSSSESDEDDEKERVIKHGGKDIRIPPGVEKIARFDAIEEYFLLRRSLDHQLNFIDTKGVIKHYNSYEEVFVAWYPNRKKMYSRRVERQLILLKYQIIELENIQRFCINYENLNMAKKRKAAVIEILERENFTKLNVAMIHRPRYTPVSELEAAIINPEVASLDYLAKLGFSDTYEEELESRQASIDKLKSKYEILSQDLKDKNGMFTGAKTWLAELDNLEAILKKAFTEGWGYTEPEDVYSDNDSGSDDDEPRKRKKKGTRKSK